MAVVATLQFVPLHTTRPVVAVYFWLAALGLRALLALSIMLVSPFLALLVALPLGLELRAVLQGLRRVRKVMGAKIAAGPRASVVVGGEPIAMAVAGMSRPRIVVSAGALTALDDAELALSLEHEQ